MFAILAPRALSLTISTRRLSLYQPLRQASSGSFRRTTITMMPEGPEVRSLTDRMRYRYGGGRWEIHAADLISGRYKEGKPPDNWQRPLAWQADHLANVARYQGAFPLCSAHG